jgi:hypothetical protein
MSRIQLMREMFHTFACHGYRIEVGAVLASNISSYYYLKIDCSGLR